MPHQLEAFKLAERGNLNVKSLSRLMLILTVIAMPLCIFMLVDTFFELGVNSGKVGGQINSFGGRAYRFLEGWLTSPRDANSGTHHSDNNRFHLVTLSAFSRTQSVVLVANSSTRVWGIFSSPSLSGRRLSLARSRNGACLKYGGLGTLSENSTTFSRTGVRGFCHGKYLEYFKHSH